MPDRWIVYVTRFSPKLELRRAMLIYIYIYNLNVRAPTYIFYSKVRGTLKRTYPIYIYIYIFRKRLEYLHTTAKKNPALPFEISRPPSGSSFLYRWPKALRP